MTEQDWMDVGRPLGVPFTLVREVYHRHYEEPILAGTRAINLAVEQYQGDHNALYLETTGVGDPTYDCHGHFMHIAISVAHPAIMRVGATVVIQRGTQMPETNEYMGYCAECRTTVGLAMAAHRVEGKVIGWRLVCETCWPTMSKAILLQRPGIEDIPHTSARPRPYHMSWSALRAAAARIVAQCRLG